MSPQGKTCATLTVSFLGTAAEAAVYSYIGIALYSLIATWWSFAFIGSQILIIVAGRCIAVFFVFYAGRLCCRKKTINFNELCFITYAGQIRGAIAFALVLKIPIAGEPGCEVNPTTGNNSCVSEENYEVLVSTTLILVMVTTLLFGTFMGQVGKRLVPPTEEQAEEYNKEVRSTSVIIAQELSRRGASMINESHYDLIQHPNEEQQPDSDEEDDPNEPASWAKSRLYRWFSLWDENTLRPFFIRKYSKAKMLFEDEY